MYQRLMLMAVLVLALLLNGCGGSGPPFDSTVKFILPNFYIVDGDFNTEPIPANSTIKLYLLEEQTFISALAGQSPFAADTVIPGVSGNENSTAIEYTVPGELNNQKRIVVALVLLDGSDAAYTDYDLIGKTLMDLLSAANLGKIAIGYAYWQSIYQPTTVLKSGTTYQLVLTKVLPPIQSDINAGSDSTDGPAPNPNANLLEQQTTHGGRITFNYSYVMANNQWHMDGVLGRLTSKVYLKQNAAIGWQWSCDGANSVVAYPEILYGTSPWLAATTTTDLPVLVSSKRVAVDFNAVTAADGVYNTSFDIWLSDSRDVSSPANLTHEIMIWTERKGLLFFPGGQVIDRVRIGGVNYDVYFNPEQHSFTTYTWHYIAFLPERPIMDGPLDLSLFFDYLLEKKMISSDLYLSSVEFGTEVVVGTGITEVRNFKVTLQ